ncbi:deoxyguanosinetriphosphate triphosphohydrolase family protein [Streptomyces lydicus]|uniref:deoxyguanosinetriphosphate triphosphohydrolase family protein n=1 Tax=Streptomyces lydicus TaxID=47763 RepID=UPI003795BBF4
MTTGKRGSFDEQRLLEEKDAAEDDDFRSTFQDDRDRILYSSAFRRLAGVTQVAAVREHHLLHNRLTHSLKVAQIGRRMAQRLTKSQSKFGIADKDWLPDIVEAAGLAHDIGHPPFGHIAEEILREELEEVNASFEGNAQSFRVVTRLASRKDPMYGLNLARGTLNAVLKYPQFKEEVSANRTSHPWHDRGFGGKWGAYKSEAEEFNFARLKTTGNISEDSDPRLRCAAAVLMDWADDVSYAIHDIADYFRAGLIPLDLIHLENYVSKNRRIRRDRFLEFAKRELRKRYIQFDPDRFEAQYDFLVREKLVIDDEWTDTRDDRFELNELQRRLYADFSRGVLWTDQAPHVAIEIDLQYQVEILKQFTWFYVINQPSLAVAQKGQKRVIKALLHELMELLEDYEPGAKIASRIPVHLRDIYDGVLDFDANNRGVMASDEHRRGRAVCDYLCALTEDQALDLYERITGYGVSRGSIFGAWFE